MINSLPPDTNQFLRQLERINQRIAKANDQISSGLRLKTASDSPDQVSSLLRIRSEIGRNTQIQWNLGRVKAEVDAAETAIRTAVTILDEVKALGSQGASGSQPAESRKILADEVAAKLQNLVSLSQTAVEGRFVFSGDSDSVPPYTLDFQQTPPISPYAGSPATRQIELPNGTLLSISKTAQELFDSSGPSESVFGTVNDLREALLSGDENAIREAIQALDTAARYLNSKLGFYGIVQEQLGQAINDSHSLDLRLRIEAANIEEADLAAAILELEMATIQQEAALNAQAQRPRRSLFDYLR